MSEPFIGRKSAIGLGLETTPGVAVAPTIWINKTSGTLAPSIEQATDNSGFGVIEANYDNFTTRNITELNLNSIVRDDTLGYLTLLTLGKYTKATVFKGTATGGTPTRGDTTSGGAKLLKVVTIGTDTYYVFDSTITGTSVTNGTWTITGTVEDGINAHFFEVKEDNTPRTATLCEYDPVDSVRASYGAVNSFELTVAVEDYIRANTNFLAKQMEAVAEGTFTPGYSDEAPFTASMAGVLFADSEAEFSSVTSVCVQNFRLNINKNLDTTQCFGDTDIAGIYNQQLDIAGDFEALYDSTTIRDMAINNQKKAIRLYAVNTANSSVNAFFVDLFKVGMNQWSKTDDLDAITRQTMGYTGQYSASDGASIEILIFNSHTTAYIS